VDCWTEHKALDLPLTAGVYTVAAVVENVPGSGFNPGGFLGSIFTVDENGDPDVFLRRTDQTWSALGYPATWPGWEPGRILWRLIYEAQERGELLNLTYDFSSDSDSAGNPWPVTQGFSMPIGGTVLDALNSFVEQGWIDYRLKPGGLVLQCFNPDWERTVPTVLEVTGVEATQNLEHLAYVPQAGPYNRLFVKWSSGSFQVDDAASQATYGVLPLYVTMDAPTLVEAQRRAQFILGNSSQPRDAITASIAPKVFADRPYTSYELGDKITVPTRTGGTSPEKLLALSVGHDAEGNAVIGAELQTRILERERQQEDLFEQLGSGVTGSKKVRVQVYQTEPLVGS